MEHTLNSLFCEIPIEVQRLAISELIINRMNGQMEGQYSGCESERINKNKIFSNSCVCTLIAGLRKITLPHNSCDQYLPSVLFLSLCS
jgi:hypothetical protein